MASSARQAWKKGGPWLGKRMRAWQDGRRDEVIVRVQVQPKPERSKC
jgi:hypothetical protein